MVVQETRESATLFHSSEVTLAGRADLQSGH